MNKDIERSRARVSRRRALALGGGVSLAGLVAACTANPDTTAASATTSAGAQSTNTADPILALLNQSPSCPMTTEETQGPYWFDVDSIRSDIREDRPGTTFELALRVQDLDNCSAAGTANVVANAVVEIWHCDAGGVYSGFESGSTAADIGGSDAPPEADMRRPPEGGGMGGPPPAGGMGASGATSDGSYSVGDSESATTDDSTYLRGAQTTDADGIAKFTTIFPGWYVGRTTHIHVKVHVDKSTVLTTQLFFDDATKAEIYAGTPYSDHAGWQNNVQNSSDSIYDVSGVVTTAKNGDGYIGAVNLGV
ncbi:protocatechuate dioxygenase [Rhodococcus sp. 1163]|uniref:protocatechuate dioxygenase n=1 Tax=unclassified Rhodococcus (in: high G+C Gram-positive bacteria) TaxID=192944 RepID=UPI000A000F23|nr:protocatechuate dioxygenase [Rhodococcus sp. 1163]ORI20524.1 protocatechuate dioxygenase [Rhodococcus sp. 1163]